MDANRRRGQFRKARGATLLRGHARSEAFPNSTGVEASPIGKRTSEPRSAMAGHSARNAAGKFSTGSQNRGY
jgi:hypothetical protein